MRISIVFFFATILHVHVCAWPGARRSLSRATPGATQDTVSCGYESVVKIGLVHDAVIVCQPSAGSRSTTMCIANDGKHFVKDDDEDDKGGKNGNNYGNKKQESSNTTAKWGAAPVLVFSCNQPNIGHFFHEVFFPFYVSMRSSPNTTVVFVDGDSTCPSWGRQLFFATAYYHIWNVQVLSGAHRENSMWCAPPGAKIVRIKMGGDNRNTLSPPQGRSVSAQVRLKYLRNLRECALQYCGVGDASANKIGQVILYTRGSDSCRRQLLLPRGDANNAEVSWKCVEALLQEKLGPAVAVSILHAMPRTFCGQVRLFNNASAVLGMDGAWQNNILFMQPTAALISFQEGTQDSWQLMYGTSGLLRHFSAPCVPPPAKKVTPNCAGYVGKVRDNTHDQGVVVDSDLIKLAVRVLQPNNAGKALRGENWTPNAYVKCPVKRAVKHPELLQLNCSILRDRRSGDGGSDVLAGLLVPPSRFSPLS